VEEARNEFSPRAHRGNVVLRTSSFQPSETDFRFLASRNVKEYVSVVLNHQVCGNLLWQPQKKNTDLLMSLVLGTCP